MYPDKEEAETSGRTATHAGKTYYFCSDFCVQAFTEEPAKYILGEQAQDRTTMPEMKNGRTDVPKPVKASQGMEQGKSKREKKKKTTSSQSTNARGVVDWDGPETEKNGSAGKDWKGWGKFPGSKYLGIKDESKKTSEQGQDMPVTGGGMSPEE
jgi:YHS domain-containing protein